MAFQDIFKFARSISAEGSIAVNEIVGFIPKEKNESINIPPHDPFKPEEPAQQDPKIVRETSPQSNIILNFINSITSDIEKSSNSLEISMTNPSSLVDLAGVFMEKAREFSDKVKDETPASDISVTDPPKPKDVKPEGWNDVPKVNNPE
jgi:hypothetical protein